MKLQNTLPYRVSLEKLQKSNKTDAASPFPSPILPFPPHSHDTNGAPNVSLRRRNECHKCEPRHSHSVVERGGRGIRKE